MIYRNPAALDEAALAAAMIGACAGFLWWNAAPARIFMGDTGSLGIGAAVAVLACSRTSTCSCPSSAACSWSRPCR